MDDSQVKVSWRGEVVSIQVRSEVWRYLADNRSHRALGFNVFLEGEVDGPDWLTIGGGPQYDFCVVFSDKQLRKLGLRVGDLVSGTAWTVLYPNREFADLYRVGGLKILQRSEAESVVPAVTMERIAFSDLGPIPHVDSSGYPGPPWRFDPPELAVYDWRGARMLSKASWKGKCFGCVWANMANVNIQYNYERGTIKHRFETFCYGPLSCKRYKMGPARSVPYTGGCSSDDCGWLDEIMTERRMSEDE